MVWCGRGGSDSEVIVVIIIIYYSERVLRFVFFGGGGILYRKLSQRAQKTQQRLSVFRAEDRIV